MTGYCSFWITLATLCRLSQGDGFPAVSEIVQSSSVLSHYTNHSSTIGQWQIFPHISFSCNCSLSGWTFIATYTTPDANTESIVTSNQLQFQIWRRISNISLRLIFTTIISKNNVSSLTTNQKGMSLAVINFDEPVMIQEGDVFGVFQPNSKRSDLVLQFQSGLAPASYVRLTNSPTDVYSMRGTVINQDYPLISAKYQGCEQECVSGFVREDSLRLFHQTNTDTRLVNHPGIKRVFPALNFTCDTTITAIKLGAKPVFGTGWPQIELWRKTSSIFSRRKTITITSPTPSTSPSVYEYTLPVPVSIKTNDVVSLYEPDIEPSQLEVYSEAESDMFPMSVYVLGSGGEEVFSDSDRPLLHIETADSDCTEGFVTLSDLRSKSLPLALVTDYNTLTIATNLTFPMSGVIQKFLFSGHYLEMAGAESKELYPEISVWRLSKSHNATLSSNGDTYVKVASITNSTTPKFSGRINVYEFETQLYVEEGDVLGYYQPPSSESLIALVAVNDGRTESHFLFGQNPSVISFSNKAVGKSTRAPLISFEYESDKMPTDDVTKDPPTEGSGSQSILLMIGAVVGGCVVVLVLVTVVSVVLCVMVRVKKRARRRKITDKTNNLHNPTYTDADRSPTPGPTYAEPSHIQPPSPLPSLPSPYSHLHYPTGPGSPYELPTSSRTGTLTSSFGPPAYSSLSGRSPRSEFAAQLRAVGQSLSDGGEMIGMSEMERSGVSGALRGGVKIYDEGVYHEPEFLQTEKRAHAWGIYVPTEEQRASVYYSCPTPTGEEDLYSELVKQTLPDHTYDDQVSTTSRVSSTGSSGGTGPAFFSEEPTYWTPAEDTQGLFNQLSSKKYRELPRKHLSLLQHLGSGQFGMVVQGVWSSPKGPVGVAVKTLKPGSGETDKLRFLQEAAINGQFRHPNVVRLIGVVTIDQPVMIILELMGNGDLRNHLIKLRPNSSSTSTQSTLSLKLLKFCQDVASGMAYLAAKSFVHRDLAARNILMSSDFTCKISDFGLSRGLEEETYYMSKGGKVPIKWTAPEALHYKKYSTASDVWSFGMVMYEIWSLGQKPFSNFTNAQTVGLLERSFCLPPPPGTPHEIYSLMVQCWHPDNSRRPSFPDLHSHLSQPASQLLHWTTEEATGAGTQAIMLGAPLKTAHKLHLTLQNTYRIRP